MYGQHKGGGCYLKFRERQLRGVLLPSLALVSLLTGVIGYLLAIPQSLRAVGDVGNALYASFRLFFLLPVSLNPDNFVWRLARWLAPGTSLYFLFCVFELPCRTYVLRLTATWFGKLHIVLGYNDRSRHYSANLSLEGKRVVVLCNRVVAREERLEMVRKGILLVHCRTFDSPALWLREDFSGLRISDAKSVNFLYEDDFENLSAFMTFCDCLKAQTSSDRRHLVRIRCRIRCADPHIRSLIRDYYEAFYRNEKGDRYKPELHLFDEDVLAVRNVLRHVPLHTVNYSRILPGVLPDRTEVWDVHLAVVGCNTIGVQFLLQAVNVGVIGRGGRIYLDVYDCDPKAESRFYALYPEIYRAAEINFHCVDVKTAEFDEVLREKSFTYIAVCFRDPVVAMGAMRKMSKLFRHVPIVVSAENGFAALCDVCRMENTTVIPDAAKLLKDRVIDGSDRLAVCMNHWYTLFAEGEDEALRESEKQGISVGAEDTLAWDEWNRTSEYARESTRAQAEHAVCKQDYIRFFYERYLFDGTPRQKAITYQPGEVRRYLERCEDEIICIRASGQAEDMAAFLHRNPLLSGLAELEHVRWCHYMYSDGWTPGSLPGKPRSKDVTHKRHPYLVSWEKICTDFPETVFYDLISVTVLRSLSESTHEEEDIYSSTK